MALHQRLRDLEPTHPTPRVTDLVGNEWLRLGPVDLREPLTFGYDARLQMCGFSVDRAALVDPPVRDEVVYRRYLEPEQGIESDHPEIRQLAESLAGETVAEQSEAAYHEVKRRISYKLQRAEYGALAGLRRGEGDCTEISALYAALLRARGIPARVAIGMYAGSRDLHAVVELYLRGLWIPVDITNHAQPFYGLPADFVILLRANWMSTRAVEKQLSYSYRASTPDALEVTESLLLRGEARRKVCVASENGEKSSVVRQVRFTSQTMGVSIEQGRRHPLRGALYLFWDDRSPHINWIAPVSLPPGRPTEVDLPEDRLVPFPGPSGGVRIGFVDTHDNMQVEAPY